MKITKNYLKKIIKEEINYALLEQNVELEEGKFANLIMGGLALVASQLGISTAEARPAQNKQQAIVMAQQNPGKVFSYKTSDGVTHAVGRGEATKEKMVQTDIVTSRPEIQSAKDIVDLDLEEKVSMLNDYLYRYQEEAPEILKRIISSDKSDAFLGTIGNTNIDSALDMLDQELKSEQPNEEYAKGALKLLARFVHKDLTGQDKVFSDSDLKSWIE
jgi:hypothetical protein